MPRFFLVMLFPLLLLPARSGTPEEDDDSPGTPAEFSGVWTAERGDLVVSAAGPGAFVGRLTEGDHGRTWHFQVLGPDNVMFFLLLEGKSSTLKLDEQRLRVTGAEEFIVRLSDRDGTQREVTFRRILAPIPPACGEVRISFSSAPRGQPGPDQNVDLRLVRAVEHAILVACRADPALSRLEVSGTIECFGSLTRRASRNVRAAVCFARVNGAAAVSWREEVKAAMDVLKVNERPVPDPRRDTARHAAALALALLLQPEIDQVVCPAVLDEETGPWLDWWVSRHLQTLPEGSPSPVGWRARFTSMLEETKALRPRMSEVIFAAVTEREGGLPLSRKTLERKWDRP
jgi:hypothetical protein